jgi:hypothetical protein
MPQLRRNWGHPAKWQGVEMGRKARKAKLTETVLTQNENWMEKVVIYIDV